MRPKSVPKQAQTRMQSASKGRHLPSILANASKHVAANRPCLSSTGSHQYSLWVIDGHPLYKHNI